MSAIPAHDHDGSELPAESDSNKRRRTDGEPATTESSAPSHEEVLAYAQKITQQYRASNAARGRGRTKSVLSFDSLFPRTTNAAQELVRDAYLNWSENRIFCMP